MGVRQFTIDVNLLIRVHDPGDDPGISASCKRFLEETEAYPTARIVLDEGGRIKAQYLRKLRGLDFSRKWVQRFLDRNRADYVPRAYIPPKTRARLRHLGEDYHNYIRVAASSDCRILVSHDQNYAPVRPVLKRDLEVDARGPRQALPLLTGQSCPRCGD